MTGHKSRLAAVAYHSPDLMAIATTAIVHYVREGLASAMPELSGIIVLGIIYAIGDDIVLVIRHLHRSK